MQTGFNSQSMKDAMINLVRKFEERAETLGTPLAEQHRQAVTDYLFAEFTENITAFRSNKLELLASFTLSQGTSAYHLLNDPRHAHMSQYAIFNIILNNSVEPQTAMEKAIRKFDEIRSQPEYEIFPDSLITQVLFTSATPRRTMKQRLKTYETLRADEQFKNAANHTIKTAVFGYVRTPRASLERFMETGKWAEEEEPIIPRLDDILETLEAMEEDTRAIPEPLWFAENEFGSISAFTSVQYDQDMAEQKAKRIKQFQAYDSLPEWAFDYHAQNTNDDLAPKMHAITKAINKISQHESYQEIPKWAITLAALNTAKVNANSVREKTVRNLETATETAETLAQNPDFEDLRDTPDVLLYAALQQPKRTDMLLDYWMEDKNIFISHATPETADPA